MGQEGLGPSGRVKFTEVEGEWCLGGVMGWGYLEIEWVKDMATEVRRDWNS
jgi:hypothetical protein